MINSFSLGAKMFYLIYIFIDCEESETCHSKGECTATGQCNCTTGYSGDFCDGCQANYTNYPVCTCMFMIYIILLFLLIPIQIVLVLKLAVATDLVTLLANVNVIMDSLGHLATIVVLITIATRLAHVYDQSYFIFIYLVLKICRLY